MPRDDRRVRDRIGVKSRWMSLRRNQSRTKDEHVDLYHHHVNDDETIEMWVKAAILSQRDEDECGQRVRGERGADQPPAAATQQFPCHRQRDRSHSSPQPTIRDTKISSSVSAESPTTV